MVNVVALVLVLLKAIPALLRAATGGGTEARVAAAEGGAAGAGSG